MVSYVMFRLLCAGRVGEGTDLFTIQNRKVSPPSGATSLPHVGHDFYELEAVISMKAVEHDAAAVIKQDEVEQELVHDPQSTSSSLSTLLEHQQGEGDSNHNASSNDKSVAKEQRSDGRGAVKEEVLVVFDRSDPEFESDSDPDDDLDL